MKTSKFIFVFSITLTIITSINSSNAEARRRSVRTPQVESEVQPTKTTSSTWWCRTSIIKFRIAADNVYRSQDYGEKAIGRGDSEESARRNLQKECKRLYRFDNGLRVGQKCGINESCSTS